MLRDDDIKTLTFHTTACVSDNNYTIEKVACLYYKQQPLTSCVNNRNRPVIELKISNQHKINDVSKSSFLILWYFSGLHVFCLFQYIFMILKQVRGWYYAIFSQLTRRSVKYFPLFGLLCICHFNTAIFVKKVLKILIRQTNHNSHDQE